MSMFPHTITLYNVESITDPVTCRAEIINHITVLQGVLVDGSKAVDVRQNGTAGADSVKLYIPFGVAAIDGETGTEKKFLPAAEFWRAGDKSIFWTLFAGKQKTGAVSGACFFIRGEAVHPEMDEGALEELYGGDVFQIFSVDTKDFGGLQHWEAGAR